MDTVYTTLLALEHELGSSSADAYRRHLADDALIVVPGQVMDRETCIAGIEQSPAWDEWTIADAQVRELGDDGAVLSYRWRSRRGASEYAALMSSVYVRRDGIWRLVLHQQTPDPS